MLTLQSWWIVRMSKLLQLAIIASVFSCVWTQSIDDQCGSDTFSPFFPHVYYFEEGEDHLTVCPPAGTQQDAVVCITRNQETPETYSRTNSDGVIANICVSTMSTVSSQWCTRSGEYDAVAIETTGVNSAGFIEIASTVRFTITFEYGPTLEASVPLRIETGLILNTITSVIIQKKVYGLVDPSYTVCQVQENGTIVSTGFSASSNPNPECKIAAGGTAIPASVASDIILRADAPTSQEETVTLFLTNTTCSQSAFRITEDFPLTITTTPTPNTITTDPTTMTTTSPDPTTMTTTSPDPTTMTTTSPVPVTEIVVAVISVIIFISLVIVISGVCIGLLIKRNYDRIRLRENGSAQTLGNEVADGTEHALLGYGVTEDHDSGVGSPGPATPNKINCVYLLCENPTHPWYKKLFDQLRESLPQYNLCCNISTELTLPDDPDKLDEFEQYLYQYVNFEHVHHLFLFQSVNDSKSDALKKVIEELESRRKGCKDLLKVWVITLGSLEKMVPTSTTNRLSFTQAPDDSGSTSNDCAKEILQLIRASNPVHPSHILRTGSEGPYQFSQRTELSKEREMASTWPTSRKPPVTEEEILHVLKAVHDNTEVIIVGQSEMVEGFKTLSEAQEKSAHKTDAAHRKLANVEAFLTEEVIRKQTDEINEQGPKSSSDDT